MGFIRTAVAGSSLLRVLCRFTAVLSVVNSPPRSLHQKNRTSGSYPTPPAVTMSRCYRKDSSKGIWDSSSVDVPCAGAQNPAGHSVCCFHGDECLSNGICHFTHSSTGGSGYYMGSCTDPTYGDSSACTRNCVDLPWPDVVYSYRAQLWYCCGVDSSGQVTCGNATTGSFSSPPPAELVAANSTSGVSSTSSLTMSASTSTGSATSAQPSTMLQSSAPASSTSAASSNPGPSTGAAAGIGVGVTIIAIGALAGMGYLWWKRRHSSRAKPAVDDRGVVYQNQRFEKDGKEVNRGYAAPRSVAEMAYTS